MKPEEKELLLKDLCARLPYGVKCQVADCKTPVELSHIDTKNGNGRNPYCFGFSFGPESVKPYLRPMSSMTEEEHRTYISLLAHALPHTTLDWLNKKHFDYRTDEDEEGLIEKGLALKAPEDMYK